tara:strand:- start:1 stop:150 length:150 start_codon:yes stop_codon:yes gene_type:complete
VSHKQTVWEKLGITNGTGINYTDGILKTNKDIGELLNWALALIINSSII